MQHLVIDIQPSPPAQKSANIERQKKKQRTEILTSTPVKKQQGDRLDTPGKQTVSTTATNLEKNSSDVRSTNITQTHFCHVCENPVNEPTEEN